jgi:photosystem II stability/assembly factor-like uncharacterized protein
MMEVEMHRVTYATSRLTLPLLVLVVAVLAMTGVCFALDPAPERDASLRLLEVDASRFDAGSPGLSALVATGDLKVAARADESVFLYATAHAAAVLEAGAMDVSTLLDDVTGNEIYLIPMMEGEDLEALKGNHRVLAHTGSHYLVAADPLWTLEIHLLPFKKRLPDAREPGLPLAATRSSHVRTEAEPLAYDPLIQAMVDSVSQDRLYETLSGLSGENQVMIGGDPYTIYTRYSPTDMCKKAAQFILEKFQSMGIDADYDYYNFLTQLRAVTFPVDNQRGWAVGRQMMVLHTDDGGQLWSVQHTGDEGALNDIVMLDAERGCIVGNNGVVMVTEDGSTWQRIYPPTSNDLNSLCFVDENTAYCCGAGGVILKSVDAGYSWTSLSSGTSRDLTGMCFAGEDTAWVVGTSGTIRKTTNAGSIWNAVLSPVNCDFQDVTCHDGSSAWACGSGGGVVRTVDGISWEESSTPVGETLMSIFFIDSQRGWACGSAGAMIRTLNGGAIWNDLNYPGAVDFRDVRFVSPGEGWVVGLSVLSHTTTGGLEWEDQRYGVRYGDVNVVATIPGTTNPEEIYIICGHYDSISQMPEVSAPGADDNGTGTVGVMEAARVLKDYSFESTLRFVCFSREEQGLVGSHAYAKEARVKGDSIVGALNFDMIGYVDASPENLDVLYNDISGWLADEYEADAALYVPGLDIIKKYSTYVGSDNTSFWDYNYPSFCGIEDSPLHNPYYHRTTDRVSTLDFDFYTDVVRAAVATLASLARVDTLTSSVAGVFGPSVFRVSPNPGQGEISIEMSPSMRPPKALRVYDVEGRLVNTLAPDLSSGAARAVWHGTDTAGSHVGAGVYFVRPDGGGAAAKIVLLK